MLDGRTLPAPAGTPEGALSGDSSTTLSRLLLRYSGTEPLARVMIEGRDERQIERLAQQLAAEIRTATEDIG